MNDLVPKIFEKVSTVAENQASLNQKVEDFIYRIDSFKDGLTIYMNDTTERLNRFNDRLKPIEEDYLVRTKKKEQEGTGWFSIKFDLIKLVVVAIFVALMINIVPLWASFINFIK